MWRKRSETEQQTDSHAGCIRSRGGSLFGRYGLGQRGRPPLPTKPPPSLPAGLSLPDEGGSEGEDESRNDSLDKPVYSGP